MAAPPAMHVAGADRVVLLVDLHPFLSPNPNPKSYLAAVLSSATSLLAGVSTSLSASRLFFSSLSPLLSSSLLHRLLAGGSGGAASSSSLSFDYHAATLSSLSAAASAAASAAGSGAAGHVGPSSPKTLAMSLLRLEHDYGWEPRPDRRHQNPPGQLEFAKFSSNLVVLFSPVPQDPSFLSEFVGLESGNAGFDGFLKRFSKVFTPVKERLVARGIHLCWVRVNCGLGGDEEIGEANWLEKAVRELGWGFSSTNAIVLGSAFVPPGLVFPSVGCCVGCGSGAGDERGHAELVLEITDVAGKPLECKSCDLEVLVLNSPPFKNLGSQIAKIHVKGVYKMEGGNFISKSAAVALVRGFVSEGKTDIEGHTYKEFFPDRVLELLLGAEKDELGGGKPIWQLILVFLHRRSYCAMVSVGNGDGESVNGFLVPLSLNYALLHVVEKCHVSLDQFVARNAGGSQEILDNGTPDAFKEQNVKKKRHKLLMNVLQTTTWSDFCEVLLKHADGTTPVLDLEDLYFNRYGAKSKKLRFLKCWIKQAKQSSSGSYQSMHRIEAEKPLPVKDELEGNVGDSEEDAAANQISSSTDEADFKKPMSVDSSLFSSMEDLEAFLRSIPQKIEQGLDSDDADLGTLAERLISLSIHALSIKLGRMTVKNFESSRVKDVSDAMVASEVSNLLLRKPKELMSKYKGSDSAVTASVQTSPNYGTNYKIREHELQILLRMEVIKSEVGAGITDGIKQKMIKEICSLLQFIDINLQGESFHSEGIVEFAEKSIKSRYKNSMGDIVKRIYNHMEFDLFDEEVECSDSLPSSNHDDFKIDSGDNRRFCETASGSTTHVRDCTSGDKREEQLMRAQERRNRDRRLSSFTSWVPDLHRVWALKHPRKDKSMHEPQAKASKRRKRRMASYDMVCETPLTDKKQQHEQDSSRGKSKPCGPVSRALFHDEADLCSR